MMKESHHSGLLSKGQHVTDRPENKYTDPDHSTARASTAENASSHKANSTAAYAINFLEKKGIHD